MTAVRSARLIWEVLHWLGVESERKENVEDHQDFKARRMTSSAKVWGIREKAKSNGKIMSSVLGFECEIC